MMSSTPAKTKHRAEVCAILNAFANQSPVFRVVCVHHLMLFWLSGLRIVGGESTGIRSHSDVFCSAPGLQVAEGQTSRKPDKHLSDLISIHQFLQGCYRQTA